MKAKEFSGKIHKLTLEINQVFRKANDKIKGLQEAEEEIHKLEQQRDKLKIEHEQWKQKLNKLQHIFVSIQELYRTLGGTPEVVPDFTPEIRHKQHNLPPGKKTELYPKKAGTRCFLFLRNFFKKQF